MTRGRPRREPPWWAPTVGTGLVVIVLVGALLSVAWTRERQEVPGDVPDPPTAVRFAGGVAMLLETEPYQGAVATIGSYRSGVLRVLPGGCLGFTAIVDRSELLVFPPGTRLRTGSDGRPEVDLRATYRTEIRGRMRIDVVHLGDRITGATRFYPPEPAPAISEYGGGLAEHVPASCRRYPAGQIDDIFRPAPR